MQPQTDRMTTKRAASPKAADDHKFKRLDSGLRIAAVRVVRERNASPEALVLAFGVSHSCARAIVKKALSNVR